MRVDKPAEAVWAHIEWRRRDKAPEDKNVVVVRAETDERVANVARVEVNREFGDLVFEARAAACVERGVVAQSPAPSTIAISSAVRP